jgi:hypothetical protein
MSPRRAGSRSRMAFSSTVGVRCMWRSVVDRSTCPASSWVARTGLHASPDANRKCYRDVSGTSRRRWAGPSTPSGGSSLVAQLQRQATALATDKDLRDVLRDEQQLVAQVRHFRESEDYRWPAKLRRWLLTCLFALASAVAAGAGYGFFTHRSEDDAPYGVARRSPTRFWSVSRP